MAFELLCSQPAPDLQGTLHTYRHVETGLTHYHLATGHAEQSFSIAFPTHALDNQGKAHVLEHVVLCGSQRYPVQDPFMAMTQRSLASFLNAMTYGDRTVYAFCTPDPTDFANLLSVYLDAVFSPLLRRESFSQEGVRLEWDEDQTPRLEGVVYHEMKGALADPDDIADRAIRAALLPHTPYAFESGGTPAGIRTLTYEQLLAFHQHHYHPANAVAISHGAVDLHTVHQALEQAMAPWRDRPAPANAPLRAFASTLNAPVRQTVAIPGAAEDDQGEEDNQSVVWAWALGPTFEHDEGLITDFVLQALAGGDASPLTQAMSQQGYGRPSTLTFAQTEEKHALFSLAMDGLSASTVPQAERLIESALQEVARNGLPAAHLEAVFAGFETHLRDRGNNEDPLGIDLVLEMLPPALAGANPLCAVNPACLMARQADLTNPAFIADWINTRLLNNPAHARLILVPDPRWFERQAEQEQAFLDALTAQQRAELTALAPLPPSSAEVLPCVDLAAVSRQPLEPLPHPFEPATPTQAAQVHVEAPTGGLLQIGLALDLTSLPPAAWPLANVLWQLALYLGQQNMDWQGAATWRTQGSVGLAASAPGMLSRQHPGRWLPMLQLSGKALERRSGALVDVLHQLLTIPDFSDTQRLGFLVESELEYLYESVGTKGDRWARMECEAPAHEQAQWQRAKQGRPALEVLQQLAAELESNPEAAVARLTAQWKALLSMPCLVFSAGGPTAHKEAQRLASRLAPMAPWNAEHRGRDLRVASEALTPQQAVLTGTTPVQFCHQSWAAPLADSPDAPLLELAARWMEHAFLLPTIREKGSAYGAMAGIDEGTFTLSSYRDPRLMETFRDFQEAVAWASTHPLDEQALKEAKISALQRMATPRTPQQHAILTLALFFTGTTTENRWLFRERLLEATAQDVQQAVRTWLTAPPLARWAFADPGKTSPGFERFSAWPDPVDP